MKLMVPFKEINDWQVMGVTDDVQIISSADVDKKSIYTTFI